ncbi:MAG: glycosyltransferase [Bacteroidales bacterium]|nr:glycosyltransferase [Bacteroidales bacterium]
MKILQLCHKPPLPQVDGGCIAMHNITQGLLNSGQEVRVLAVTTPKHPVKLDVFPEEYLQKTHFESVFIDTTPKIGTAIGSLLRRQAYQISRFYSKEMADKLIRILTSESFDIVHVESIYMTPYIPVVRKHSNAKIVLRMHNIEHLIWERLASNERNPFRKWIYKTNCNQLRRVEEHILESVDGYMAISDPDFNYFFKTTPNVRGTVVPFGIDMRNYEVEDDYIPSEKPSLFHIGSMNWSPNVEGMEWFLDEVWPGIHEQHPELTFTLAGRSIPASILQRHDPNVTIAGAVPSANEFMLDHDIMVVPLLSGSGIRIKIVEAMALGRVVVTTSVGAEGLSVENGKHLFIADTPEEFLAVIDKCIATPDICTIIGENARDIISVKHNNSIITGKMLDFYQQTLNS